MQTFTKSTFLDFHKVNFSRLSLINFFRLSQSQSFETFTKSDFADFHKVNMVPIVLALLLQVGSAITQRLLKIERHSKKKQKTKIIQVAAGNDVSPAPRFLDQFSTGHI